MINPILDPIGHRKHFEKIQEDSKFKVKKKAAPQVRTSPTLNTTVSKKHVEFLNNLAVDLTVKFRKVHTIADVIRLIIDYAENFKDELPLFYEVTR